MRILIVSNAFYPQNSPRAFRTTELVKEFSRQNHEVTLYLPESQHDLSDYLNQYPKVTIKTSIKLNNGKTLLLKSKLKYYWNLLLTIFLHYPYIKYYFRLPKVLANEKDFDLLISIAYPHPIHWGIAKALKKHPRITKSWVADCGDPYMLGGSKKPFYFKCLEKSFCRRADFITVPIEEAKGGYYAEFRNKIKVIPQAFDFNEISLAKSKPNDLITFAYAGRFVIGDLDPRPILKFLSEINLDFRFIVFTNQKGLFTDFIESLGDKLILKEFTDRISLITELSKMDFLLNLIVNDPTRRSSKLIDYTLSGRPILSLNSRAIDKPLFNEFLSRDYTRQTKIDISESNIKVACQKFLELQNATK